MNFYPNFHISWPTWVNFVIEVLHRILFENGEFSQNRYIESHTLRKDVDESLPCCLHFSFDLVQLGIEDISFAYEYWWVYSMQGRK
jgi:hypothetical protein